MSITSNSSPAPRFEPSTEAGKRLRAVRLAETTLARMNLMEPQAEFFDTVDTTPARKRFAERYRGLIGVMPEHRDALRGELGEIINAGRHRIAMLLSASPAQPKTSPASGADVPTGADVPFVD